VHEFDREGMGQGLVPIKLPMRIVAREKEDFVRPDSIDEPQQSFRAILRVDRLHG
jgi:hypothetical protein